MAVLDVLGQTEIMRAQALPISLSPSNADGTPQL